MKQQTPWFRNRIIVAVLGALLIGGVSAGIAVRGGTLPSFSSVITGGQTTGPTATPTVVTQTVQGSITNIARLAGTFTLSTNAGNSVTVLLTSATKYRGALTSAADLQVGSQVQVVGEPQSDGSLIAVSIAG
jgi:hypothetical protein